MPGSATSVFSCNDGGIFKSTNQGTSFTDLSGGIDIKQYYRLSCSNLTAYLIYAGAQDNGSDKITGLNTAVRVNGADGEDCLVDYSDDNIVFVSSQGGNFYRSSDGGNSFSGISIGSGGDWTTPIIMDANNHNIMYAGYSNVWKSTNNGSTWSALPGTFDGTSIYSLEISSSNSQYIYAATFGHIYQTTNGGTTWTDRTGTLPVASAAISGIAINGSNPDNIWVTFSGFVNGQKVYISTDGGASWANISGTLPNIPANCVEYQNGSNDIVYIGTDLGVFYMDATMNDWVSYNTGLPNVVIDQLEINYPTSKIRAATYGRGIWESDLQTSTLMALDAGVSVIISPSGNSCDTLFTPDVRIRNYGLDTLHSAVLHYYLDANPETLYNWNGTLVSLATADIILPSFILTGGSHTFTAYTTAPNASTDMNSANDAHASSFSVLANPTGLPAPVTEGFVSSTFPPAPWTLENSSALWLRSSTVGGYGLSTNSAYANFWAIASGEDKLVSANLDFTNMIAPITLTFDVAYAYFTGPPPYIDTLAIDIVSDCDLNNPLLVYAKGGDDLATAPSLNSTFIPIASQWRTDTVHLDFLAGTGISHIRFLARSGYGNYCYVDNINLRDGTTNIHSLINNTSDVILYPNPAAGILNVEVPGLQQASVEIYDAVGNHISSVNKNISSERFSLNISNLSNGIYFLNIKTEGGFVSKRFTVLR
jgi:photosystem II stability/assembly factor-like uncharacterized protein